MYYFRWLLDLLNCRDYNLIWIEYEVFIMEILVICNSRIRNVYYQTTTLNSGAVIYVHNDVGNEKYYKNIFKIISCDRGDLCDRSSHALGLDVAEEKYRTIYKDLDWLQ